MYSGKYFFKCGNFINTAQAILKELSSLGLRNRGVKDRRDLYVINNTSMPALLVECAFVDNTYDMKNYNLEKTVVAIYKGICTTLALSEGQQLATNDKEYYILQKDMFLKIL